MFPISDTEPNRYGLFPFATVGLIFVNILILFTFPYWFYDDPMEFLYRFGSTPYLIINQQGGGLLTSLTSMFIHAGLLHLASNMLALWVFGRRVEDACGPFRFLLFYLFAGISADILSTLVRWNDIVPSIGASGAVFGIMGAYLVLYPGGRIRTLIWYFTIPIWPRIRAIWIILYFLALQVIPAINMFRGDDSYTVNYWAHLGGFFAAVFILLFLRPAAFARYLGDTPV